MQARDDVQIALDKIVRTLTREYKPSQIILFGSQAYGTPTQASDIDLLIVKESPLSPYKRSVQVRRLLRDPHRRIPIDVLIITPAELETRLAKGDQFIQQIVSNGEVLYAA